MTEEQRGDMGAQSLAEGDGHISWRQIGWTL